MAQTHMAKTHTRDGELVSYRATLEDAPIADELDDHFMQYRIDLHSHSEDGPQRDFTVWTYRQEDAPIIARAWVERQEAFLALLYADITPTN